MSDFPPSASRPASRVWLLVIVIGAGIGLIVLFVYALSLRSAALVPAGRDLPAPATASPEQPAGTADTLGQESVPLTQVVADINGRLVTLETVQTMAHIDQAMTDLLGAPAAPDLLERTVNGELVWQAAAQAGVQADSTQVVQDFNAWLSQTGRSQAELQAGLQAHGIDLDTFRAYFGRLQQVDRFSAQQAEKLGLSVPDYIRQLQRQARISFGPAAVGLANQNAAAPASAGVPPIPCPCGLGLPSLLSVL